MDRVQFMERLKRLLADISEAERNEALDYYESYFDDAGSENEGSVIRELGSPGKVAAIIKADLKESNDSYAEYTELGYEDIRNREESQVPDKYTAVSEGKRSRENDFGKAWGSFADSAARTFGRARAARSAEHADAKTADGTQSYEYGTYDSSSYEEKDGTFKRRESRAERGYHVHGKPNNRRAILILVLLVLFAPAIQSAAGGVLGVVLTIVLLPFLLTFGLGAAAIGMIIGAVACIVGGIIACFTNFAAGALAIGVGCLLMAVALVFLNLVVWAAGKVLPGLLRKVTDFFHNLLQRERKDGTEV